MNQTPIVRTSLLVASSDVREKRSWSSIALRAPGGGKALELVHVFQISLGRRYKAAGRMIDE
jgi:hypothetical protein